MSLIHGSRGLIYFVHQFRPRFIEAGLLADPEMLSAVTALNGQIRELAPVLNSPTVSDAVQVTSSDADVPVDVMVKRHEGAVYVFAVAMRARETTATFALKVYPAGRSARVLGEAKALAVKDGRFEDHFGPYEVHLYRIE
jgi:hypothetical protein